MAQERRTEASATRMRGFAMADLVRLAAWGTAAAAALFAAVLAGSTPDGEQRLTLALAQWRGLAGAEPPASVTATETLTSSIDARPAIAAAPPAVAAPELESAETRRLAETVRMLADDRERLQARLDALERQLGDVTGSIARAAAAPDPPPSQPAPQPAAPAAAPVRLAPEPVAPGFVLLEPALGLGRRTALPGDVARAWARVAVPAPPQAVPASTAPPQHAAPEPVAATRAASVPLPRPDPGPPGKAFAIDLGGGASIEVLRARWTAVLNRQADALGGLRPLIGTREPGVPTADRQRIELRLLAGPVDSAAAAARLCARIVTAGVPCHPALFEGRPMPLR